MTTHQHGTGYWTLLAHVLEAQTCSPFAEKYFSFKSVCVVLLFLFLTERQPALFKMNLQLLDVIFHVVILLG